MAYSFITLCLTPTEKRESIRKDMLKHSIQPNRCFKSSRQLSVTELPITDGGDRDGQSILAQPHLTIQQQDNDPSHVGSSHLPDSSCCSIDSNQQYSSTRSATGTSDHDNNHTNAQDLDGLSFAAATTSTEANKALRFILKRLIS